MSVPLVRPRVADVVFRLYDTTGNLRVTYAPVSIGACGD